MCSLEIHIVDIFHDVFIGNVITHNIVFMV